ncbi:hypothetical protein AVEN_94682-1 [Araneus ventricosus]|uniref:Uncharacterized protein n=1 Tax=Araneus ventricosus TaxID=182803 RepID=A0A4Y2I7Z5_ARAVE|nr:hypothetical protein AVEN_94682-1 [Araneus ventricosus]
MAALHINPPENFTFSTPCSERSKWKMRDSKDIGFSRIIDQNRGNEQILAADQAKFELFKGLGSNEGCYSIKLKPGSIPNFAITSPDMCRFLFLKQTKGELERMVEEKVIIPVLKPTELIVHRKELFAADALSKKPSEEVPTREELEAEIDTFIQMITSSLPASSRRLDELKLHS